MSEGHENDRTQTARGNDDSELIDQATRNDQPSQQGRSGGDLAKDVGTQAAEERVSDPDAREGVTKEDDIAHGQRKPVDRRPD